MKKIIITILTLFLIFINSDVFAASAVMKRDYRVLSNDGFAINAQLSYLKEKGKDEYGTVVLLHSKGYNSEWWETLPKLLIDKGYAVLTIDIRGHGKSVYNKKLSKVSWKSMTQTAYAKCPDDVINVIEYVKDDNSKKIFFDNWAIVGADLGASIGVIAADKLQIKPKTIVMLSPIVRTMGLYIPVSVAQLDNVDFLSLTGSNDYVSQEAEKYIRKFSQAGFTSYVSKSQTSGMLLLKQDKELSEVIAEWVSQYLQ